VGLLLGFFVLGFDFGSGFDLGPGFVLLGLLLGFFTVDFVLLGLVLGFFTLGFCLFDLPLRLDGGLFGIFFVLVPFLPVPFEPEPFPLVPFIQGPVSPPIFFFNQSLPLFTGLTTTFLVTLLILFAIVSKTFEHG
jgi:hypothetical protein